MAVVYSTWLGFICAGVATAALCPDLWTQFGGSCYHLFEEHETWAEASVKELDVQQVSCAWFYKISTLQLSCRSYFAHLVTITSKAENDFLEALSKRRNASMWIGARDNLYEGKFLWIENNEMISFSDWYPGEPNNAAGEENCVNIDMQNNFQWNDAFCHERNYYICEIRPEAPSIG